MVLLPCNCGRSFSSRRALSVHLRYTSALGHKPVFTDDDDEHDISPAAVNTIPVPLANPPSIGTTVAGGMLPPSFPREEDDVVQNLNANNRPSSDISPDGFEFEGGGNWSSDDEGIVFQGGSTRVSSGPAATAAPSDVDGNDEEKVEDFLSPPNDDDDDDDDDLPPLAPNDPEPDTSLAKRYAEYLRQGLGRMIYGADYISDVELLVMLKKSHSHVYMFNQIKDWARKSVLHCVDFCSPFSKKRNRVIKDIADKFNIHGTQSKTITLFLPGSGETVNLVVHDFKEQLYSLLSDPAVMRDENLLFHGDDPFQAPMPLDLRPLSHVLHDVNDGIVFRDAYEYHILVKGVEGRDILVTVIFFLDKTHVDVQGRLTLEPLTFTLSLFKKEVRTKPMFWRTLGYVINQSQLKNVSPKAKYEDYHLVLEHVLQSLVDVQNGPGIAWQLRYKGKVHEVVLKLPVLFVVGDTEGHDKMCGKFQSRSRGVARFCRYCDCPSDETDSTNKVWPHTKGPAIASLVAREEEETLRGMAYHCIKNAFRKVVFCDPKRGINGATLAELLHVWCKGLFIYFLAALFGQRRALKKTRKVNKGYATKKEQEPVYKKARLGKPKVDQDEEVEDVEDDSDDEESKGDESVSDDEDELEEEVADGSDDDDDEDPEGGEDCHRHSEIDSDTSSDEQLSPNDGNAAYQGMTPSQLSVNGVFTTAIKAEFDVSAKLYGRCLAHQSDRSFARAYFSTGITTNAKKNASEERSVLLLCLIILLSDKGPAFDERLDGSVKKPGNQRSTKLIEVLSQLLLMENYLKIKEISLRDLLLFGKFVPHFLENYKRVVARADGMGMKFIKFHLPMHAADDIRRFGPATSWDSSTGESNHKEFKNSARHTQKNTLEFERQTANRHYENLAINRAARDLENNNRQSRPPGGIAAEASVANKLPLVEMRGAKYFVTPEGMFENNSKAVKLSAVWPDSILRDRVQALVQDKILPHVPSRKVVLSTELKLTIGERTGDLTLFRANPSYGKLNHPWHDWADIDWKPDSIRNKLVVPGRLVIYLTIDDWVDGDVADLEFSPMSGPGSYVIVQSLIESIYTVPPNVATLTDKEGISNLPDYLAHPVCSMIYWSCFGMVQYNVPGTQGTIQVPELYVVPVAFIKSTRIVVPYYIEKEHDLCDEWLIIEPLYRWEELLVQDMKQTLAAAKK